MSKELIIFEFGVGSFFSDDKSVNLERGKLAVDYGASNEGSTLYSLLFKSKNTNIIRHKFK